MGVLDDFQSSTRRRKSMPLLVPVAGADDADNGTPMNEQKIHSKFRGQGKHVPNSGNHKRGRNLRRKRRTKQDQQEEPFWVLVLKVGTTLLVLCLASYHFYRWVWPYKESEANYSEYDDDDYANNYRTEQEAKLNAILDKAASDQEQQQPKVPEEKVIVETPKTPPPLPVFDLSKSSKYDAFGIVQELNVTTNGDFWRVAKGLKNRFSQIYGGENAARMILDRGLSTFAKTNNDDDRSIPSDTRHTACRIRRAQLEKRPFRITFGGYSVTAGRGNYFSQSFPSVMKDILHTVFHTAGIELTVRNAAIGGIPAFPYGWCMVNFWGDEPDVVSWDYSMNEAGGVPEGLEAYVRHLLTRFRRQPKLIVKDTFMATKRRELLNRYMKHLNDPVVIHTDPAAQPFLSREEDNRPVGFQQWRKFGAPHGAPGQALHHPAVKEHELIAWMLAMHLLSSLELVVASGNKLECNEKDDETSGDLPPPVSGTLLNSTMEYPSILFGLPNDDGIKPQWSMNPLHCRTSFQPLLQGDLTSIVVNGTAAEDIDVLLPKSMMFYNRGWTMDLSEGEKSAKRKLTLYEDGLGFVDGKQAYYGIFNSGTMRLLLPYTSGQDADKPRRHPKVGDFAKEWFESVVICQVNEKRDSEVCNAATDMDYRVGGLNVSDAALMKDAGTLFLGKKLCTRMSIPSDAKLTSRRELEAGTLHHLDVETKNQKQEPAEADKVGLLVEIFVTNRHIVHIYQACSVSHVIWEQRKQPGKDTSAVKKRRR